ncbi:MAG: cephalosporin hydroxylase family protein [Gammaproteobacteria bacterium]|nr:cephalosporin hydroxylase family protein [Gammaproteobacteria bacterium]
MKKHSDDLKELADQFFSESVKSNYSYNFEWMSRPIIQYPQDIVATQEIIWKVKPDLIIETGIAHGGSLVFSASMLALLDYCEALESGTTLDPENPKRKVIGIDIDIRSHNREALDIHPMRNRMELIEGSSIAPEIISKVHALSKGYERIVVFLDSNHTHDHVLAEMEAYAPLVSPGSYCVVFDSVIEDLPDAVSPDRPWGPGNSPKTALYKYLDTSPDFIIDKKIQEKLLITVAPDGYLLRK